GRGVGDTLACEILLVLDWRVCFHVPGEIVRAGVRCRDHADRRAFGKGSECIECADAGADIGAARDHGLLGFAGALGIENLQHEPVLLEETGVLPQLRKGIFPRPCQSPGNPQFVLRDGGAIQADNKRERRHCEPETKLDHFPSSTQCREAIQSTETARVYRPNQKSPPAASRRRPGYRRFPARCRACRRCRPSCPAWAPGSPRHRSGRSRPSLYRRRSPPTPLPHSLTPAPSNVAQSASASSPPESCDARCITTKREKPVQPDRRITIATAGSPVSQLDTAAFVDVSMDL